MMSKVRNVRPVWSMGLLAGLVLGGAAACEQGVTTTPQGTVQETVSSTGSISGRVLGLDGVAVAGARVGTPGGASTLTGAGGEFTLDGLAATDRLAVTVSATGFAPTTAIFRVLPGTVPFRELWIARRGARTRINPAEGGVVQFADGGRVTFPAGSIAGVAAGELVDVQVTFYDPGAPAGPAASRAIIGEASQTAQSSLAAAPGDFSAVEANGTRSQLETAGAVDVLVTNARGTRLNVAPGRTVTINVPDRDGQATGVWGLYRFDASTGRWVRAGDSPPAPDGTQTAQVADLTIPWNIDKPLITACIRIRVQDSQGLARANQFVQANGVNWRGPSSGSTDASGDVDLQVRASSSADVTAGPVTQTFSTPTAGPTCVPSGTISF
jgi:hypothetical protein